MSTKYKNIHAYSGIGSDIKWCGRWSGRKRCLLCQHYAPFEEWSSKWHWHYLLSWSAWKWGYYRNYVYWRWRGYNPRTVWGPPTNKDSPDRYFTTGINENNLKALLKRGCRKNSKCKCMSVVQRGSWYCPECYHKTVRLAELHKTNVHNIMITDRNELKQDLLILLLSGTL